MHKEENKIEMYWEKEENEMYKAKEEVSLKTNQLK